jgi:hypothetical protein
MNNPIVLNDPDGDEPPSIKQILDEGKKSPTFTSLLKASNVTDKNYYTNIVTSKNNITYTDINSGRIYLTPGNDIKYQVIKLTHELTNKKNIGSAQKLNQDVSEGKITPQQYALQLAKVEVEGQINQVKVAADINFRYPGAGSASVNKLITDYSNNKSIDLTKKVTYSTEHLKHYEQQGKNLRENFVKSNSQPKPQPKKP